MGQVVIRAWGSMAPVGDGEGKTYEINHVGSYAQTVDAARLALNEIEDALRKKVGNEAYEAAPEWAKPK